MVYVILVNIILNNRLCYNLIGRDINIFSSYVCVVLGWLDNIIQLYMLIRLSIKLYIYVFSLNYWLYKCIIIYFLSRSCNCLSSSSFLQNWFSCNWSIILIYRFCFLKLYQFVIVYDCFLVNWLCIYLFCWGLNYSIYSFFCILCWLCNNRHIIVLSLSFINLKLNILCQNCWLDVFFLYSCFSWYLNRYIYNLSFSIYNWR